MPDRSRYPRHARDGAARAVAVIAMASLAGGCERPTRLAGAVTIGPTPVQVTFATPIIPAGVERAICFEVSPPGESEGAEQVLVVLLTSRGERDTLLGHADRAGEATVCLRDASPLAPGRSYTGAEFTAPAPMGIRRVLWAAPRIRLPAGADHAP